MVSSSSNGNRMNRSRRQGLRSRCWCGDLVGKWTAWTPGNPGRRFVGCPNVRDESKDCKYFHWVDPPLPNDWYINLLTEFHHNGNVEVGDFGDQPMLFLPTPPLQQPLQQQEAGGTWKFASFFCVWCHSSSLSFMDDR
ncbi:hypothetical protein LXL04_036352 [Taraxacum kok-saghyz]